MPTTAQLLDPENAPLGVGSAVNMARGIDDIAGLVKDNKLGLQKMEQGDYFHQGRTGDFFAAARLVTEADGTVDPARFDRLQAALDKAGFNNVVVSQLAGSPRVFMRVATPKQQKTLHAALSTLGDDLEEAPTGGSIVTGDMLKPGDVPVLDRALARFDAQYPEEGDPAALEARTKARNDYKAAIIDMLPETNIRKVYQQREGVQGYQKDQLNSNAFRGQVTSRAIATAATRADSLEAVAQMHQHVRATNRDDGGNAIRQSDIVNAYLSRTAASAVRVPQGMADMARGFVHSYYIAASPAYVAMQVSQVATLVWPELAKGYGFGKAGMALIQSLPETGRILAAIAREGHSDTGSIDAAVLRRSGVSQRVVNLVNDLENSGHIETGSFARSMGAQALKVDTNHAQRALAYANGVGTMSEVAGRLVAAIAADKLHQLDPRKSGFAEASDFAARTISEGMFNWGAYDTPEAMTAGGPLGRAGPLVFQFHQFTTKLVEKIAHETANGFTGRFGDAAASRKFMLGHLAAVTFFAGSLGLPMAGWAAAATTQLTGLLNQGQGYDVQAHYRDFLASMLGKGPAEMIARGVPRYLGVDMAELGDNHMLPMQEVLEDHRGLKDAMTNYLGQAWGSTPGIAVNALNAAHLVSEGRIGEGMTAVAPTALKNLAKAYRLSAYGYVNSRGERLPLTADASAIMKQALGFTAGDKAEEDDRERIATNAQEDARNRSSLIKQQLAVAIQNKDQSGIAKWMSDLRAYDRDPLNKGKPIGNSLSEYIASRNKSEAYSRASGLPLGLSPSSIAVRGLVNF